jgi:hypothetical protein
LHWGWQVAKCRNKSMHSTYFSVPTARSIFTDIQDPLALNRPMFFNRNKMERICELFPENPRLKDLKRRVLIPSFEVIGPEGGVGDLFIITTFQVLQRAMRESLMSPFIPPEYRLVSPLSIDTLMEPYSPITPVLQVSHLR